VGINTKVVSGVDISSEEEIKQALEIGVAQAKGTALPDEEGTIYLFGHSTDYAWNIQKYNAWLYPLKDLQPQDQIIIAFNNKLSFWQVKERKIAQATDLTYLSPPENGQRLVLQTCWPPGTTLKRLIVIAEPQEGLDKTNLLGLN
jgi:sortase A